VAAQPTEGPRGSAEDTALTLACLDRDFCAQI